MSETITGLDVTISKPDKKKGGGGDFTMSTGAPGCDADPSECGDFIFKNPNEVLIKLRGDGKVFVRGTETDDDFLIYAAFKSWLEDASKVLHKGESPDAGDAKWIHHDREFIAVKKDMLLELMDKYNSISSETVHLDSKGIISFAGSAGFSANDVDA